MSLEESIKSSREVFYLMWCFISLLVSVATWLSLWIPPLWLLIEINYLLRILLWSLLDSSLLLIWFFPPLLIIMPLDLVFWKLSGKLMKLIIESKNYFLIFFKQFFNNFISNFLFFRNLMITIPTLLITCLIGALYTGIIAYISILGGFCSVVIAFLFPGLLYVKNNDLPITHYKNIFTIILITILCLIGFTAGTMTILDDILHLI